MKQLKKGVLTPEEYKKRDGIGVRYFLTTE